MKEDGLIYLLVYRTIFIIKEMEALMKKLIIYSILLFLNGITIANAQIQVSETKYDYTSIARQITQGTATRMEQARSIYQWMCKHIAYDTTYQIYTADECWDTKKGVCQAYCELFYRLGEPLGLNTQIISGKTKDSKGNVSRKGHSWVLVEVESGWILIDPTWGAGGMDSTNNFQQKDNDMSWFHIDPYWLIFTHFPDDERYQLLDTPISWKSFVQLPSLYPALGDFGWRGKDMLSKVMAGEVKNFPTFHDRYASNISLTDIPLQKSLRPGQYYTFKIEKKKNNSIVLIHDGEFVHETDWERIGNEYTIRYMPVSAGTLKISVATSEKQYSTVVAYQVASPNTKELESIEKNCPYRMPELKHVKNLDVKRLKEIDMDGAELLAEVRKNKIQSIPLLYKDAELFLSRVKIPFNEKLKIGENYVFSFIPKEGVDWQIINGDDWYGEWTVDKDTGRMSIQITPKLKGKLKISVQRKEGGPYSTMVGYQVIE